jgi:phage I-like protein
VPYGSITDLPASFKNLTPEQKRKGLRIVNALLEDGMEEGRAIRTAISRAKGAAMSEETFHSLALAEAAEELSQPFTVLTTGDFVHSKFGRFTVSESDLDKMVANFDALAAREHELPLDYDHAYGEGRDAPAAGWFKKVWRDGSRLLAQVKWTERARKAIAEGEYRYVSPEFSQKARDEHGKELGAALLSAGLTNRPHIKGMRPVALSDETRAALAEQTDEMRSALDDLAALAAERRPVAEKPNNEPAAIALAEGATIKIGDQEFEVTSEHVNLLTEGPPKPESDDTVVALRDTVTSLSARVEKAEGELFAERFTAFMSQARREGRIDAKEETTKKWRERAEKLGLEECKSLMADIPAETIAMSERGHGDDKPGAEPESEVPDGVDPEAHRLHERAVALAEEKNIEYEEAVYMAAAEAKD